MSTVPVERLGPYLWRIPQDARPGMHVPGLVVADDAIMHHLRSEAALEQVANGATLPGIVKASRAMPDIHQGYGLPVGGVVATDREHGVVSPGAIGFDHRLSAIPQCAIAHSESASSTWLKARIDAPNSNE